MLMKPSDDTSLLSTFVGAEATEYRPWMNTLFNTKDKLKKFLVYGSVDGEKDNPAIAFMEKAALAAGAVGLAANIWSKHGKEIKSGISDIWSIVKGQKDIDKLKEVYKRLQDGSDEQSMLLDIIKKMEKKEVDNQDSEEEEEFKPE